MEEAMGWWSDPNNDSVYSYNYTMGWTPAQVGVTASAANNQAPAKNAKEYEAQLRALNPGAPDEEIMQAVINWEMSRG